jgi:RES domain-containing protein
MRLWRLSSLRRANDFDGGYGLSNNGRWNSQGRPVTYCATVPSLAALEKRVHVTDASLLPPQVMVEYDAPDDLPARTLAMDELPADWTVRETTTQNRGDEWLATRECAGAQCADQSSARGQFPHQDRGCHALHARPAAVQTVDHPKALKSRNSAPFSPQFPFTLPCINPFAAPLRHG